MYKKACDKNTNVFLILIIFKDFMIVINLNTVYNHLQFWKGETRYCCCCHNTKTYMPHDSTAKRSQILYPHTQGRKCHVTLVLVFAALCEYYILLTARLDKGQGGRVQRAGWPSLSWT